MMMINTDVALKIWN